ncbi:src kinase-associated phosphoprotein 1 isoform X2 [Mugil cephalus]|uniref:src kinase-associated phosphoprotein 1 isoform X2 n=1 Tax=Mugil cephalus TaxID=48193 RepID=UPI001FB6F6A5|nr:src kinase-associated phosphoprotein 1 isoform X2 [Mugil cephalus]
MDTMHYCGPRTQPCPEVRSGSSEKDQRHGSISGNQWGFTVLFNSLEACGAFRYCELFVAEILLDENLSENAEETRQVLLNNFRVVHARNPQEFPLRADFRDEEGSDDNRSSSLGRSDDASVASDYQDDGVPEYYGDIPPVAAQDLSNILKQGNLEKKRKEHSFFGPEWQKRWCVLNNSIFYYFGTEKDKQQKGSFYINDCSVQLVTNLRKDSKKNSCFEISAPGRRAYQFTASSPQEAREWVNQINFVLRDLSSNFIPVDDEEEEEEEETYDDIGATADASPVLSAKAPQSAKRGVVGVGGGGGGRAGQDSGEVEEEEEEEEEEEDIYEVLPEEDFQDSTDENDWTSDYANYYQGLWDCPADEPDELEFQRGDLIYIISKEYNIHGWWVGELNGSVGIVPKDFLHPAYIL